LRTRYLSPGRIAAIADVFDALTSERPYRDALPVEEARAAMLSERGTHFDPGLLDIFLSIDASAIGFCGFG
jgi:putative two-component system response regulator